MKKSSVMEDGYDLTFAIIIVQSFILFMLVEFDMRDIDFYKAKILKWI